MALILTSLRRVKWIELQVESFPCLCRYWRTWNMTERMGTTSRNTIMRLSLAKTRPRRSISWLQRRVRRDLREFLLNVFSLAMVHKIYKNFKFLCNLFLKTDIFMPRPERSARASSNRIVRLLFKPSSVIPSGLHTMYKVQYLKIRWWYSYQTRSFNSSKCCSPHLPPMSLGSVRDKNVGLWDFDRFWLSCRQEHLCFKNKSCFSFWQISKTNFQLCVHIFQVMLNFHQDNVLIFKLKIIKMIISYWQYHSWQDR